MTNPFEIIEILQVVSDIFEKFERNEIHDFFEFLKQDSEIIIAVPTHEKNFPGRTRVAWNFASKIIKIRLVVAEIFEN